MQQKLTIVSLGVADLKTADHFYENCFGWKKTGDSNESISFFKLNGILLALYNREKLAEDAQVDPSGNGFKGFTLAHILKSKEEVDNLFETLKAKDVKVVKAAEEVFWGGYSGYIADPDGNLWEIAYNPYMTMDEEGNVVS
jgi:catechol 2,3-dioxygenase-like lactoylglutathione lyase family enzyme